MNIYESLGLLITRVVLSANEQLNPPHSVHCQAAPQQSSSFFTDFSQNNRAWNLDLRGDRQSRFFWANPGRLYLQGRSVSNPSPALSGPSGGSEIVSRDSFGYGTYRFRVQFSVCDREIRNENLINGLFVYLNDGMDHDQNHLVDNREIDFEFACDEPHSLYLSSWTDYSDETHLRKVTRRINFETGEVAQTARGGEGAYGLGSRFREIRFRHPELSLNTQFNEMGFRWTPSLLSFFIVLGGREVNLWNVREQTLIPLAPAQLHFNLWFPAQHWDTGQAAQFPREDSNLLLDCFSFSAFIAAAEFPHNAGLSPGY
ncbi:MAG: glycoside hydrolase family 16 protein [Deltaproteobacteria bacterium]|nr:glycoside hydrolase family 16 protein [Deltaproteobacteria bacterium]